MGTVVQPERMNEGDEILPGTVVQTGADGVVMVRHQWPSDVPSRDCVLLAIFGYGQSYTVSEDTTPGRCETTVPTSPGDLAPGRPFLARETRYGDAKFDDTPPERVLTSQRRWQAFDAWVRNADRAFTGSVTAVTAGTIRVRPASGPARTFTFNRDTVSRPVSARELLDQRVRLDYRARAARLEVVRVQLLAGGSRGTVGPVVDGGLTSPPRPERPTVPGRSAPGRGAPPTPPSTSTNWECSLDLHQGDTGTLVMVRTGEAVRGKTAILRGPQTHEISGIWSDRVVRFDRTLSETSRQVFVGVAEPVSPTEVRMAGRFAAGFRGIWSAECRQAD
jgi:hypothetical protein